MTQDPTAPELIQRVLELADPEVASGLSRYFQVRPGGYGEGDEFVGVRQSTLRTLVRPYGKSRWSEGEWTPLLEAPLHELRMVALLVMAKRMPKAATAEQAEIVNAYLSRTIMINNWDLVDASAAPVLGAWLIDRERSVLDRLAASDLLWDRRIAMIATHHLLRRGESTETYRIAELLLHDTHDLMHKAVGWSLREAGARVDGAELRTFLDEHAASMPRTALRYAIEHFPPEERQHFRGLRD